MISLHKNQVKFNSNITISHTGGRLSSDSGLVLVKEVMNTFNFSELAKGLLHITDHRAYFTHDNIAILEQFIMQLVAGYSADSSANLLRQDPVFQMVLGKKPLASQSSLSRFLDRFSEENIHQLQSLNQALIDQARLIRNDTELIIDIDSTHSDTFGHQEQTDYNAHYQTYGYHPLVAFDGLTGDFLKAELRSGNQYTSKGVKGFIDPLLLHYNEALPHTDILVRGDSGFATPEVYESCEANSAHYVIRLKNNQKLSQRAEQLVLYGDNQKWEEREVQYFSVLYQAQSWSKPRRVCIRSVREGGELLFQHSFIVTSLSETISPEAVFSLYGKRGTMENFIKEAKSGFYFDKTDSPRFLENHVRMMMSVLAYNLVNFLKTIAFEKLNQGMTIHSIRLRLLKVAGKLVQTGRQAYLKLSSYHVYQAEFYKVFERLRQSRQWI
ncbi:Transposase DDE domain group 1 [Marinilactibacillus piezotolerans]|uniref:Transposase DDE domain group 1 n=3 Tax=Marinilactibacillus piezotolerans TaxID=258723 RepID=A0A1I4C9K8_9LACT|nr:IS1380 family transposase [Marinilactibacillus piezotolerans]SFK77615.1 Transposase DDE domain group 1 [Marinilactibacillus piezotolerans]